MTLKEAAQRAKLPTVEFVQEQLSKFDLEENYQHEERVKQEIIRKLDRNRYETILLTVIVINELYSTHIINKVQLAKHIFNNRQEIFSLIDNGDNKAVERVAKGHGIGLKKEINFYSFASKFCYYFNENDFPIYDSYVENMLRMYNTMDKFHDFIKIDFRDYGKFKDIIDRFMNYYGLKAEPHKFTIRDIDKFLWFYGTRDVLKKKKNMN